MRSELALKYRVLLRRIFKTAHSEPQEQGPPHLRGSTEDWGCWTSGPRPHPWLPIADMNCGYDGKMEDPRCLGCHRQRKGWPHDQLKHLPR
jgi:hypothetical protein